MRSGRTGSRSLLPSAPASWSFLSSSVSNLKRSSRVSATAPPPPGTSPGHHTDGFLPLQPPGSPCTAEACSLGVLASSC